MHQLKQLTALVVCLLSLVCWTPVTRGKVAGAKGEWRFYGGDAGATKYAPLDQINRSNVQNLKVAWTWDSPDAKVLETNSKLYTLGYEATPLMVNGVLYISTSLSQVAAINAATGKTLWVHDPKSYETGHPTNLGFLHRGVAYWTDGKLERIRGFDRVRQDDHCRIFIETRRRELAGVCLGVRIVLTENQRLFTALGYVEYSREAHPGFDYPTSINMRKALR